MTYQALYRVWRPRDFEELAGQDPIRRTLENAVVQGRISHAYLFSGPRGTGKTSAARILAKALNCSQRQGAQPCGECASCQSIAQGNAMDVLEIDAASNRGIDEIRDIKEKIAFLPALGRYKVYIVDEAHMLTQEAFNALLKTLEEPPDHVIFILATTEPQRMPSTVLSRCQRFDFRKLSQEVIEKRLGAILAGVGRQAEPGALSLIIRQADGSLRDAISLLDQCLSYTNEAVTVDDACAILGLVRQEALASLLSAVISGDAASLFAGLEALFTQGVDPMQLIKEFAGYCRDLLLVALCGPGTPLVTAAGKQRELMEAQSNNMGPARLRRILDLADQVAGGRARGNSAYMAEAFFAGLLLDKAGGQAQAGAGGRIQAPADAGGNAGAAGQARAEYRPRTDGQSYRGGQAPAPSRELPSAMQEESRKGQATPAPPKYGGNVAPQDSTSAAVPGIRNEAAGSGSQARAAGAAPIAPENRPPVGAADAAPIAPENLPPPGAVGAAPIAPENQPPPGTEKGSDAERAERGTPGTTEAGITLADGELSKQLWESLLQAVKSRKIILHAYLMGSVEQELRGGRLILYFDPAKGVFHKERSQETENLALVNEAASEVLGCHVEAECAFLNGKPDKDPIDKAIEIFGRDIVKLV